MSVTIEATYEDGVLKPKQPLRLEESQTVYITIDEGPGRRAGRAQATYGMIGWKGDAETIRRLALDPEFGIEESA